MDLSEINWDFNVAGSWPLQVKAMVIAVVCCLVVGGGFYYITQPQLDELDVLEKKEKQLIDDFTTKQAKAVSLADYHKQLKEIESRLGQMMKQMPSKAEVANLLFEISQTASTSGLESKLFQPAPEIKQSFYVELPTSVEMEGKYEELGLFVSGVASMARIVTVHDINLLALPPDKAGKIRLTMKATIKTYTDLSEGTNAGQAKDNKKP
jgi:type IV pilus assembly protein PilO